MAPVHFLHEIKLDTFNLIRVFSEAELADRSDEDELAYREIINDFNNNDFSLLTTQEKLFLEKNPQSVWPDYLVFRWKFKNYTKRRIVSEFPIYLLIEPVSLCNLRCVMCFQSDRSFSTDKSVMGRIDFDFFKTLVDQAVAGGTKALTMASRGEPTMHKRFVDMLRYVSGKFIEIKVNTNAIFLDDDLSRVILETGVTDLVFSIDSYTKENYEKIRLKSKFEKVLENIQRFQEIQTIEFPNARTVTRVSGVRVDEDQNPELFKAFWEPYVDHVAITDMAERWDTYNNSKTGDDLPSCRFLWERMYIWYDGTVNPCDVDYKSMLSPGNVAESSIQSIWHSEAYQLLREAHMAGKRSEYTPCDRCGYGI